MLTQEKMVQFNQLIASNGTPAPEDVADFEIYKAMLNSQAMAASSASQSQNNNPNFAAPTPAPVPAALTPVETPVQAGPVPNTVPANGSHFTMDDLMAKTMAVDKYLKVKYQQMFIGDDVIGSDHIFVRINLDNVVYKLSIKGGQPVSYASTLDGKTATTGGSWLEAVADIQAKDAKARPYNCADIPMVVAKEIKSPAGMILADEGTILGHTTSTTNWREWVNFYQSL
ncbi:MAG: hypothetical protein J6Z11_17245, partial [Candidatus Riflebacteria bacterium]|nr:hypothetical protein [Candidatus Riflebacteria bacterium]